MSIPRKGMLFSNSFIHHFQKNYSKNRVGFFAVIMFICNSLNGNFEKKGFLQAVFLNLTSLTARNVFLKR